MIQHELLHEEGISILKPEGALRAEDFGALAGAVDPYIDRHGELKGLMIEAPSFPGWENFAALLSHLRFVRTIIAASDASLWSPTARCSPWRRRSRATSWALSCVLSTLPIARRRSPGCRSDDRIASTRTGSRDARPDKRLRGAEIRSIALGASPFL
jgi:hypothetical protein